MSNFLYKNGSARATLVEYGTREPVLHEISSLIGVDRVVLRDQIMSAGERIVRTLGLSVNPFCVQGNDVRVVDVAGLLRVSPRFEIEIAPKFLGSKWTGWREDFFFISMLSRHGRLLVNERLGSSVGAREDLATLVARAMISMFWENHRRPLRTYRHADISDFVVDGDVDPETIVLPPVDGYAQRVVTYDRRNTFNSSILAAAKALLLEVRDPQTRQQLSRVTEILAPQFSIRRPQHRKVPNRAKRWQSLHDLAIDVLRGFGVAYNSAMVRAPGFIFETWRVWEDLITISFRLGWGTGNVVAQRHFHLGIRTSFPFNGVPLGRSAWVKPDIVVSGCVGLIADAKYKGRVGDERNRISEEDLYEALAFASATKHRQIVLLYPAVPREEGVGEIGTTVIFERVVVEDIEIVGMEVEVRGISRTGGLLEFSKKLAASMRSLISPNSNP